ncbi:hypothetical protein HZ326_9360 [Fusarium oxysporum f. sp. albedinis]|nr:hypothetical protein HZ326_9360 [Fusarium oxysporum f. sp. albedinis]
MGKPRKQKHPVQIITPGGMSEETEHHTVNHHLAQWRSRHLQAEGHASLGEFPSQQGTQITLVSKGKDTFSNRNRAPSIGHG